MATKKLTKAKTPVDEKFEKQDFDLFDALLAIDKKDYGYLERMTEEQQKKFVPYMMTHWVSAVNASSDVQGYYLMSVEAGVNKHLFNENVQKHPKLQWLMMCASSLGIGKQYHQWIPHLSTRITQLKESAKEKEIREYFTKIYPKTNPDDISDLSAEFVKTHKKKTYLAKLYPNLKINDIETLVQFVTDEDIKNYERELGN
jgi:hypothetical protein